jgi:hypothetical protein
VADVAPATLFAAVERIGGATGWYYGDWLWRLRGLLDHLLGGVGMRRGQRDPLAVAPGDPIDSWRVEDFVPGRLLERAATGSPVRVSRHGGRDRARRRGGSVRRAAWCGVSQRAPPRIRRLTDCAAGSSGLRASF